VEDSAKKRKAQSKIFASWKMTLLISLMIIFLGKLSRR